MIQLDGKGFIKGTNKMHKSKVVVIRPFSTKGRIIAPGDVIEELSGSILAECLSLGKVRMWDPAIDDIKKEEEPVNTEKLGPKKSKKSKKDKAE